MQLTGESQTLELASTPESISVVERMIDDIRNKYNVSEDMFGNMLVAITEAVTNAIYHGNKSDGTKKVSISCTHAPAQLFLQLQTKEQVSTTTIYLTQLLLKIWRKNVVVVFS